MSAGGTGISCEAAGFAARAARRLREDGALGALRAAWRRVDPDGYDDGVPPWGRRAAPFPPVAPSGRPVVLVVDGRVPRPDRDAGSRSTYMYMRLLLSRGFDVRFVSGTFCRREEEPYATALEDMGVGLMYGSWLRRNILGWISENQGRIHRVFLNRPDVAERYIGYIKERTRIKVVYYGHDLHFLRLGREARVTGDVPLASEAEGWRRRELAVMRRADAVYYPSSEEVGIVRSLDPAIPVRRINVYVLEPSDVAYEPEGRRGILFVGGFSHRPNVDAVLWYAGAAHPAVLGATGAELHVVGSRAPREVEALGRREGIVVHGAVSDGELEELYGRCRMAVVPLRYGAGVKGKVLEALGHGLPLVTTSMGAEGIDGLSGVVPVRDGAEELAAEVSALYGDPGRLRAMSSAERAFVGGRFGADASWSLIRDDFVDG